MNAVKRVDGWRAGIAGPTGLQAVPVRSAAASRPASSRPPRRSELPLHRRPAVCSACAGAERRRGAGPIVEPWRRRAWSGRPPALAPVARRKRPVTPAHGGDEETRRRPMCRRARTPRYWRPRLVARMLGGAWTNLARTLCNYPTARPMSAMIRADSAESCRRPIMPRSWRYVELSPPCSLWVPVRQVRPRR